MPEKQESTNVLNVYEVYNTDWEGRGSYCGVVGYFSSPSAAEVVIGKDPFKKQKVLPALKVGDKVYLLAQRNPIDLDGVEAGLKAQLKLAALAKLTKEEKEVLGL